MDSPARWVNLDDVLKILDDPDYDLTIDIDSEDHESVQAAAEEICSAVCENLKERIVALAVTAEA